MRPYEVMCILDVAYAEDERRDIVNQIEHEIIDLDGEIFSSEQFDVRDLAYPINNVNRGDYRLITFNFDPEEVQTLRERLNFRDDILRYLIVRLEEEPGTEEEEEEEEEPAAEEPVAEESAESEEPEAEEEPVVEAEVTE